MSWSLELKVLSQATSNRPSGDIATLALVSTAAEVATLTTLEQVVVDVVPLGEDVRVIVVGVAGVGDDEVALGVHRHGGVVLPERADPDLDDAAHRGAGGVEPAGDDVGVAAGLGLGPGHHEVAVAVHRHRGRALVVGCCR